MKIEQHMDLFEKYLEQDKEASAELAVHLSQGKNRLCVSFAEISKFSPQLAEEILDNPTETLRAFELVCEGKRDKAVVQQFRIRLIDLPNDITKRIRDIRANMLGKIWTFEGIIEAKSDVRPNITSAKFECPSCANIINILQSKKEFREPSRCGCGRKGKFRLVSQELTDAFTIRLQELPEQANFDPELKVLNIIFRGDMTESKIEEKIFQGIRVKVSGVLMEIDIEKQGQKLTRLDYLFEANYIEFTENEFFDLNINEQEQKEIEEISRNKDAVHILSQEIYNSIHGYNDVKEALLLQLFGGVSDYSITPKERGEIHLLLIGDPGEGKTDFIKLQSKMALKAVEINSKTASDVGMVGIPEKDEIVGGWTFRVGPVPRANKGVCCIDEFNTLEQENKDILLEPMENGTVSINKASISRKFTAQTSFLIACNPKDGYFDNYKTIYSQFDISQPLMTRIDLSFLFKSSHDEKFEENKAKVILNRKYNKPTSINSDFIKKYISIAKKINPQLTKDVREEYLPKMYSEFKKNTKPYNNDDDAGIKFPISPRYVNIIKRIAEAKARVHLKALVTKEEIDYAMSIIKKSLMQTNVDPATGKIDVQMIDTGISKSERSLMTIIKDVIYELSKKNKSIPTQDIIEAVVAEGHNNVPQIEEAIDLMLWKTKDIFQPRQGFISLIN